MELGYDASAAQAAEFKGEFQVLSPGWKLAVIKDSALKLSRTGGKYLELTWEITKSSVIEEIQAIIVDRLNIHNNSEVAQKIARAALGKIIKACGIVGAVKDSCQLHGIPIEIKIAVKEFESNAESGKMLKGNEVKDYRLPAVAIEKSAGEAKAWF